MAALSPITRSALAAVVVPLVSYTLWLVVSRGFSATDGPLDWAALAFNLAVGAPFVWRLPWSHPPRSRAVIWYVALGALALSFYTWAFSALFYGGG